MPYNPDSAISYAHKWAFLRNPRYANFDPMGGDCTNFISQCVFAGGFPMNYSASNGWFFNSLSSRSPSWSGVEFLRNFIVGNRGTGPKGSDGAVTQARLGDIIQLSFDGVTFGHSLLVVGFNGSDPLITTHTYDSDNRPLSSYMYSKARAILINN
ncbi:MAG: amidase domain-containing protein [Oscillospiraceae bacterium]|nr:amidase domain-containing protein [Oscillospiraceae bacterium]